MRKEIHSSIHYSYPFSPIQGHGDPLEPNPALFGRKAGVHPGQVIIVEKKNNNNLVLSGYSSTAYTGIKKVNCSQVQAIKCW